jgi:outer membrane protein assembly factor BamB
MWSVDLGAAHGEAAVVAAPTVVGDLVVVSLVAEGGPAGPGLAAYDKYVGTLRWVGSDPQRVWPQWANVRDSAAAAGELLVFGSSLSSGLQAVDAASGVARWAMTGGVECERQLASPVVVGDLVYLARADGTLSAVDVSTGDVVWSLPLTVAGERAAGTGCAIPGRIAAGAPLQATPAVAPDGTIVVGSLGGVLYAVGQG